MGRGGGGVRGARAVDRKRWTAGGAADKQGPWEQLTQQRTERNARDSVRAAGADGRGGSG